MVNKRKCKLQGLGSRDYVTWRICDPVEQMHIFTSSYIPVRGEDQRKVEGDLWRSLSEFARWRTRLWLTYSQYCGNRAVRTVWADRDLIKFWSRWLGCKSRQLSIECLSHHPLFPGKVGGSILKVACFLAGCRPLNKWEPLLNSRQFALGNIDLYSVFTYTTICFTETKSIGKEHSTNTLTWTLLNKVCFHNTPSEFPNTPRCVVVTHLFIVLFHSSRKHTFVCKETHKVCKNYTPLCLLIHTFSSDCNTP